MAWSLGAPRYGRRRGRPGAAPTPRGPGAEGVADWPPGVRAPRRPRPHSTRARAPQRPSVIIACTAAPSSVRAFLGMRREALAAERKYIEGRHPGECWRGGSNPGRRGAAVKHGPRKRALISFDYPGSARRIPPFGHRVPKLARYVTNMVRRMGLSCSSRRAARCRVRSEGGWHPLTVRHADGVLHRRETIGKTATWYSIGAVMRPGAEGVAISPGRRRAWMPSAA